MFCTNAIDSCVDWSRGDYPIYCAPNSWLSFVAGHVTNLYKQDNIHACVDARRDRDLVSGQLLLDERKWFKFRRCGFLHLFFLSENSYFIWKFIFYLKIHILSENSYFIWKFIFNFLCLQPVNLHESQKTTECIGQYTRLISSYYGIYWIRYWSWIWVEVYTKER